MYSASVNNWAWATGSSGDAAIHVMKAAFSRRSHLNRFPPVKRLSIRSVYNGGRYFTNECADTFGPTPFHRTIRARMPSALLASRQTEPWIRSRGARRHGIQKNMNETSEGLVR
jgi:hypothetical protein